MTTEFDFQNQTKQQVISQLTCSDITRQIDKMDLHDQISVITLEDAAKACTGEHSKSPNPVIHVKTYVTRGSGMYGYQFLSYVWISIDGKWFQASGTKTCGCGYDKISEAIGSAFNAIGVENYIGGAGRQMEFILALAKKLLGRKKFFVV